VAATAELGIGRAGDTLGSDEPRSGWEYDECERETHDKVDQYQQFLDSR
jgi:hypothetical protein